MNKLLLVDDEEGIRKVLGLALREEGYEVDTAESGAQALELFDRARHALVITDIKMPGMDGIRLLQEIKSRRPLTEVIIITGHGEMNLAIQALKLEASDFITKPIEPAALAVALQRAKEKIKMRLQLQDYTEKLEQLVADKITEITRMLEFQNSLVENAQEGIFVVNPQGETMVFNRYMERLSGHGRDQAMEMDILSKLFPGRFVRDLKDRVDKAVSSCDRTPIQMSETTVNSTTGPRVPVQVSAAPLYKSGVYTGLLLTVHDLRLIKKLQQDLLDSERLAVVGQTVAGLAHGIKNILGGLKGGIYVVDQGIRQDNPDYLNQGWDMVKRNVDRIKNMVMDLLDYSKERVPEYEVVSPNAPAEEVYKLMKPRAEEFGVEIELLMDRKLPMVAIDPDAIHTCLANAVTNAIDACSNAQPSSQKKKVCLETASDSAGNILYRITDNGCGMDQETLDKVFKRFFTTKGSRGTGLGMMITEKIVRSHGGRVHIASSEGEGSTVVISIPGLSAPPDVA